LSSIFAGAGFAFEAFGHILAVILLLAWHRPNPPDFVEDRPSTQANFICPPTVNAAAAAHAVPSIMMGSCR
jgi:hypothetical protein